MEFNVGFALWSNDFTQLHNMSQIEDYVYFEATLNEFTYTFEEGRVYNRTVLKMVPCGVDDLYEAYYSEWSDLWPQMIPFYMCLPNYEDIALYGNYLTFEYISLDIRLVKCTNKSSCKNDTEIDDFIDKNGQITTIWN